MPASTSGDRPSYHVYELRLDEGEQIVVDLIFERGAHAVGCAFVDFELRAFNDLGRAGRGICNVEGCEGCPHHDVCR